MLKCIHISTYAQRESCSLTFVRPCEKSRHVDMSIKDEGRPKESEKDEQGLS